MYKNHGCLTYILLQYTRRQKIIKRKIIVLDVDIKKHGTVYNSDNLRKMELCNHFTVCKNNFYQNI